MKITARILCLLIVMTMLLSAIACGGSGDSSDTTTTTAANNNADATTTAATTEATTSPYDENGYLKSSLPEDLNFGGETVTVLWWTDVEKPEFIVEEQTGDLINDAIYNRNMAVEEKLGVTLGWDSTKGQYNDGVGAAYAQYVGNGYNAGDQTWDLMAAHSRTMALTAQYGYCADMMPLDYLDFEKPWWPTVMTETATIGESLYFVTGDASINALHMMYVLFYNKDLVSEYKLEDPAQLVKDGKWTNEALFRLTKDLGQDLNNDSKEDKTDFYGLSTLRWHLDAIYYGSDLILVENDPDALMLISDDFYSEKAINLCGALADWCATTDVWINDSYRDPFYAGNAVFTLARHKDVADGVVDAGFSYGILPAPKYDEAQEKHLTAVGNPVSFYSIYANSKDKNRAAAVLECWAAEAYRTTTPALFETTMKLKYSETSVESEMYDIIRAGIVFDMGRLFHEQLSAMIDIFTTAAVNDYNFQTQTAGYKKVLPKSLEKLTKAFYALQNS